MGDSAIEWTGRVWNPIAGCSIHTPGCTNCYAMRMAARLEAMGQASYAGLTTKTKAGAVWNGKVRLVETALTKPLSWLKPQTIFVNSMSDLFHEGVPDSWIDRVLAVMALTPQHTYQILTKRPDRARDYIRRLIVRSRDVADEGFTALRLPAELFSHVMRDVERGPLPNVWLGASVEDQVRADERRAPMSEISAAGWLTFVSYEPALGPVDWTGWEFLRWLICGGESGPKARPMHPDWARGARDFCSAAGVAFFFKQWGAWAPGECVVGSRSLLGAHWDGDDRWSRTRFTREALEGLHVDEEPDVWRVGKKAAGRWLDGVLHDARPVVSSAREAA